MRCTLLKTQATKGAMTSRPSLVLNVHPLFGVSFYSLRDIRPAQSKRMQLSLPLITYTLAILLTAGSPALTITAKAAKPVPNEVLAIGGADSETALRNFKKLSRVGLQAKRVDALEQLIALGDWKLLGPVAEEMGAIAVELRKAKAAALKLRYEFARNEELIADLERREKQDPSIKGSLESQRQRLGDLESKLASRSRRAEELGPWYEHLRVRVAEFSAAAPSGTRKKVLKQLWKGVGEPEGDVRRKINIEALGCMGEGGTAVEMQKAISGFVKERSALRGALPKLMTNVQKLERRMQEEAVRTNGRSSMEQQYQRAKAEAAGLQKQISALGRLCESAVNAGGLALSRESREEAERSIQALMRAQKKGKDGARRYSLLMVGASQRAEAGDALMALLVSDKEPLVRESLVEALILSCSNGTNPELQERFSELLLTTLLVDESWFVRSGAVSALSELRSKEAIPVFITRLEEEEGRMLDDLGRGLLSLTGLNFHGNQVLWERWWKENGEGFVVPPLDEVNQTLDDLAKDRRGSTFFGISTESTRVLYVVDLSGSMNFSMIPRNNPEDTRGKTPDMPRDGERSRLDEARFALKKAVAGSALDEDGLFNVIFYASDVWSWRDDLAELSEENRAEALDLFSRLEAVGGTNIYGALKLALEMAGADPGDRWAEPDIDTIYFLSDGRASIGLTTDSDELLGFVRDMNASAGIVIHTIGLSGAQDAYLLRSLAEQNGGVYVSR
ncbi:MAG: hypothetical protein ACI8X5_003251 [Planctomycetota bacterium]|jgi:hypothetical protein